MFYDILLVVFLAFLLFTGFYLGKKLFFAENEDSDNSPFKQPIIDQLQPTYNEAEKTFARKKKWAGSVCWGILLAASAYLIHSNTDFLTEKLSAPAAGKSDIADTRYVITPGKVEGHAIVDGVNWIKIVATSTSGVPFEGWVSELAIHKEPPKENKMADAFMEKIGLPTNRERIESIRSLKKVGNALKESLKDVRPD